MDTMQTDFSPSINIVRDFDNNVNYIPTPNSRRIFRQISNNYDKGTRAFNIIGSYGTGKSAFLLAFEKHFRDNAGYYDAINGQFDFIKDFKFLNLVGDYSSIVDSFAQQLQIADSNPSVQLVFNTLSNSYKSIFHDDFCLIIVVDELGKFLEFASVNNPERELYFIQQLAEFANDTSKNVMLITALHQSFDAYAKNLDVTQRYEWQKVKGRLKTIPFNEPVEQLLFLGAQRLKTKPYQCPKNFNPGELVTCIRNAKVFPLHTDIDDELAKQLYPIDILAAAVLTKALQDYGQNERSLFTFLDSDDYLGLSYFNENKKPYYNLPSVYDYLLSNFSSELTKKYSHNFFQWRAIQQAIDRIEANFLDNYIDAIEIIKTIGLLSIFASSGSKIDEEFLTKYSKLSLGISSIKPILKELENKKIIRFLHYKNQYILYEGTDLDIEIAIENASENIPEITDIVSKLGYYFDFPFLSTKSAYYQTGTPRFFQFELTRSPSENKPKGMVDGIINLIFSSELNTDEIIEHSIKVDEAIIFGLFHNTSQIRKILFEIEKINYVIQKLVEDRVAERELRNMLEFQKQELNRCVLQNLYQNSRNVSWIFRGDKVTIDSYSKFNHVLSNICQIVYSQTPVFKNELINREKLPSAIIKARNNLLTALVENLEKENLAFEENQFPPEKSIYLTILKETGIHRKKDDGYILDEPSDNSFKQLWQTSLSFLDSAKNSRKQVSDFVEILSSKPIKLKKGFIDFWLPVFLFIKREDYALFSDDGFIPIINTYVLELLTKHPRKFQLKAFDLKGINLSIFNKYRTLLNQAINQRMSTSSFIETIKPFLTFYKSLPEYSKHTKRLSKNTLNLRDAISNATDPEITFFEDFPQALGYSTIRLTKSPDSLMNYIDQLQKSIQELRSCFDNLLDRIENYLLEISGYKGMDFNGYRQEIRKRYDSLNTNLLLPHQIVFYKQLKSELDDRRSWLRALVQATLDKPVEKMRDDEEELVMEKIYNNIQELDNLCEITKIKIDPSKEEVIKLELTTLKSGRNSQLLRVPTHNRKQISELVKKLKNDLGNNKRINLAALLQLIQEENFNE